MIKVRSRPPGHSDRRLGHPALWRRGHIETIIVLQPRAPSDDSSLAPAYGQDEVPAQIGRLEIRRLSNQTPTRRNRR